MALQKSDRFLRLPEVLNKAGVARSDLPPMMVPVVELVSGHGLCCPFKKGWSVA